MLRKLQEGESLELPYSRPLPSVGARCHELRDLVAEFAEAADEVVGPTCSIAPIEVIGAEVPVGDVVTQDVRRPP